MDNIILDDFSCWGQFSELIKNQKYIVKDEIKRAGNATVKFRLHAHKHMVMCACIVQD